MKSTETKKIYSFILLFCGVFFITGSDLMAQCKPCSGKGKVRITKITYSCPYGCEVCRTKCVSEDQLEKYYQQGWTLGDGCGCGGNDLNSQLNADVLPLTVSADHSTNSSNITFSLTKPGKMSIGVFDMTGRSIATIADTPYKEGEHEISWITKVLTPGIYLLKMQSGKILQTKKFIVMN